MSPSDKIRSITSETILNAVEPEEVFGLFISPKPHWIDGLEIAFRALARVWNPDIAEDPIKAESVMKTLRELRGRAEQKITDGIYGDVMSAPFKSRVSLKPGTVGVSRLVIVQDDIFTWSPRRRGPCWPRFDTIYIDIWPDIHPSNIIQAGRLCSRAKGWLAPGGWIGDWDTEVRLFDGRKL